MSTWHLNTSRVSHVIIPDNMAGIASSLTLSTVRVWESEVMKSGFLHSLLNVHHFGIHCVGWWQASNMKGVFFSSCLLQITMFLLHLLLCMFCSFYFNFILFHFYGLVPIFLLDILVILQWALKLCLNFHYNELWR